MSPLFRRRRSLRRYVSKADILSRATDKLLTDQLYLNPGLRCIDVAKAIGTNRTYLWDALRDTGYGFQEYVIKFRLRYFIWKAYEYRELSCAEIAERCGFNNPKVLNRCLKKTFGLTLSEYMEKVSQGL
ncbi:MAG: helix-turn-helix domain-containing protein [Bacteroidales bacterium]|nr:helix-turn-helix domain-containing protein [Bacteroidales bacterium]